MTAALHMQQVMTAQPDSVHVGATLEAAQLKMSDGGFRHLPVVDNDQQVVGVNAFQESDGPPPDLLRVDPSLEREQVARLKAVRASREAAAAREALDAIQQAAAGTDNLMEPIFQAVKARCSLGEIADSLRDVYGVYRENVVV